MLHILNILEVQAELEAAQEKGKQAEQKAEDLGKERSAAQLEAADLQRHCKDLQGKASTLTVHFWWDD